jgi:hypothetical protein
MQGAANRWRKLMPCMFLIVKGNRHIAEKPHLSEEGAMTLDQAQAAYEADPCIRTLSDLFKTAREYEADGMIGDDTFQNVLAIVEEHLEAAARMEEA